LTGSPSRVIKKELIEREEISRESRKVGEGKVSSKSTEEVERIVIEDSVEGESYMVRTLGTEICIEEGEEPLPPRDVLTPVMESTPVEGREKGNGKLILRRPLTAPKKKLWVEPKSTKKRPDEGESSSSESESSVSKRSNTSMVGGERRGGGEEDYIQGVGHISQGPPRRYGARSTRVQVDVDSVAGVQEISAIDDEDGMMTGGDGDGNFGVRRVSARSWLEGSEVDLGGDLEDLDDQLFHLIQTVPAPWTISPVLRVAVVSFPDRAPWYLRMKISTILLSMRKTAQHILMRSIRNAPAVNPLTTMTVPLDMDG